MKAGTGTTGATRDLPRAASSSFVLRPGVSSSGESTCLFRPLEAAGFRFGVVVVAKALAARPALGCRPTCEPSGSFNATVLEISSSMSSVEFHVCMFDHAIGYPVCRMNSWSGRMATA